MPDTPHGHGSIPALTAPAVPDDTPPASKTLPVDADAGQNADISRTQTGERQNQDPRTGRFLPGNCANPNGRVKGSRSLTSILRDILAERLNPDSAKDTQTRADAFVRNVLLNAEDGNGTCVKEVWERMDGKVPERVLSEYGPNWELVFETPEAERQDGAE